jgi:hypothetical protein
MDTAANSFRLDPVVDVDLAAELSRLDPTDVDALLDDLERLLDLSMRAGGCDRVRSLCCCRRFSCRTLLLKAWLLIHYTITSSTPSVSLLE